MPTLDAGTIKRIHVNQHVIRHNKKHGTEYAAVTIQHRGKSIRGKSIKILGPSEVIDSPKKALSCGAHVWVETRAAVTYEEANDDYYEQVQACPQNNRSGTRCRQGSKCRL